MSCIGIQKACTRCKRVLGTAEFHKDSSKKDQLSRYCRMCNHLKCKEYYKNNKIELNKRRAPYWKQYKQMHKIRRNARERERKLTDPIFKLVCNTRNRLWMALKNNRRFHRTSSLLGCSYPELKAYIENKFSPGMSWENYGRTGWHLDHIRPCASFDLTKEAEQKQCFHYTNLQPLWAEENLKKSDHYVL